MAIVTYGYSRNVIDLSSGPPRGIEIALSPELEITLGPDLVITLSPDDVNVEVTP